jgi:hypothetical protein
VWTLDLHIRIGREKQPPSLLGGKPVNEDLERLISEVVEESVVKNQRAATAQQAAEIVRQQQITFLAEFSKKIQSVIKPTLEEVAEKIEKSRKIGRWGEDVAGAANELAADLKVDEENHSVELILSRRGLWATLKVQADQNRQEVAVVSTVGSSITSGKKDSEWLQLSEILDGVLERRAASFFGNVKTFLAK